MFMLPLNHDAPKSLWFQQINVYRQREKPRPNPETLLCPRTGAVSRTAIRVQLIGGDVVKGFVLDPIIREKRIGKAHRCEFIFFAQVVVGFSLKKGFNAWV